MILKTTTNEFCFINVSFYETVADPRHFFSQEYDEMPEYEEESNFDFDSYCNAFIPYVQKWADEVKERLLVYGVKDIKVISVGHPREYNYDTDWMEVEVESQQQKCLYRKVRSIYSMTCIQQKPTNYITMFWINTDGRDPKYKSETELCTMLKWAEEKGLTIEELSI